MRQLSGATHFYNKEIDISEINQCRASLGLALLAAPKLRLCQRCGCQINNIAYRMFCENCHVLFKKTATFEPDYHPLPRRAR
jgi:hypothetical protein